MHRLKLSQMPTTLDRIAEEATAKALGYLDFLERLLEEETQAKHHRNVTLKTQLARFPYVKRLEAFEFSFQPSLDAKRIKELASLRFLEERANVLFLGPPGVGKTHLAIALGVEAITQGYGVVFTTLAGLLSSLERAKAQNKLEERLKTLGQPRLLILDEIGYVPLDQWGATCLFQIVCQRYERGSIILTSNKSYGDWGTVFPDPIIASAILDRLLHHSTTIVIKGPSYRLKDKRKAGVALPVEPAATSTDHDQ
jgi:DNA replication protein DnaC